VCDMIGVPGRADADGLSLLPLLTGGSTLQRNCVFSEFHDSAINASAFMLRKGKYKYIVYPGFEPMLFDLENDRWELHNLAGKRPGLAAGMDALLRGICDYDKVFGEVVACDKRAFAQWRESGLKDGTYRENMNWIFSGFDRPKETVPPGAWTDEEEKAIVRWMELPQVNCCPSGPSAHRSTNNMAKNHCFH